MSEMEKMVKTMKAQTVTIWLLLNKLGEPFEIQYDKIDEMAAAGFRYVVDHQEHPDGKGFTLEAKFNDHPTPKEQAEQAEQRAKKEKPKAGVHLTEEEVDALLDLLMRIGELDEHMSKTDHPIPPSLLGEIQSVTGAYSWQPGNKYEQEGAEYKLEVLQKWYEDRK